MKLRTVFLSTALLLSFFQAIPSQADGHGSSGVGAYYGAGIVDGAKIYHDPYIYRTWSDAEKYCNEQGMRLPTAYELALALNPKGVSKTAKDGFDPIDNEDRTVAFYYNRSTYPGPPTDEERHWLWTSSVSPYGPYAFCGDGNGYLIDFPRDNDHSMVARCVAD
jgi:hypothetical protein